MAQALKNLRVSRAQNQPPRVTRTGRILATIVIMVCFARVHNDSFDIGNLSNVCPKTFKKVHDCVAHCSAI